MSTAQLTAGDKAQRELILNGNLWSVLLRIGVPLALFQSLNQLFRILDSMMAAHVSPLSVSAVAYLSQISMMLSAVGGGLAIGASIKISAAYGAGDFSLVRRRVSTLFAMCAIIGVITLCAIPLTVPLLRLAGTPEEFISVGARYFSVSMIDVTLTFFTTAYIAIERARGNARRILLLNLAAIAVKLSATAFFVYVLHSGVTMISVASVLSDMVIISACIYNMGKRGGIFGFSAKEISLRPAFISPMLGLSFPVMVEKAAFSFGKVIVNSMSAGYGALTVGALGISNNIGGITTNPQNGFQEAGSSIISQNLGAGNRARALETFYKLTVICTAVGAVGYTLTTIFLPQITQLFASGDPVFGQLIATVYRYEALGTVPLGVCAAVMALLYGFGYTKLTLLLNFSRVFILRIPVLWGLQNYTVLGSRSVGIVMMVSNILTGVLSAVIALVVVRRIKRATLEEEKTL